jgi:competence protein ComEC
MGHWQTVPFVRILLPFIAGILIAVYAETGLLTVMLFSAAAVFVHVFLTWSSLGRSYNYRWFHGLVINLIFLTAGIAFVQLKSELSAEDHFSKFREYDFAVVTITEPPVQKAKSFKLLGRVSSLIGDSGEIAVSGNILLYLEKDSLSSALSYGDNIIVPSAFREVQEPPNPDEFNFKRYLHFKNIHYQQYVTSDKWSKVSEKNGWWLISFSYELRDILLSVFRENIPQKTEMGIAEALLFGYKDDLDPAIVQAYASTGTLHVLAVSGLHVAIVFYLATWSLIFLDRWRKGRIAKALLIIGLLAIYALVTGLSPSVLRAVTMFSFIIIGKQLNRNSSIYNTLAASAFILLCIDPLYIADVGFQLSYIAVLGIVFVHPRIYELWIPRGYITDKVWQISSVSLAAQLATFPLGLFYFHQFPNYFLVSNLIIIPLTTLIVYAGILLLLLSPVPFLATLLGKLIGFSIWCTDQVVLFLEKMPFATISGLSISPAETILIYALLLCIIAFLLQKNIRWLHAGVTLSVILGLYNARESLDQHQQKKIIVYSVGRATALGFMDGTSSLLLADTLLLRDEGKLKFHISNNLWKLGIKDCHFDSLKRENAYFAGEHFFRSGNFMKFYEISLCVADEQLQLNDSIRLNVDILLLCNGAGDRLADLQKRIHFKKLVIDSSHPAWKAAKIEEAALMLGIECHNVIKKGYFELDI